MIFTYTVGCEEICAFNYQWIYYRFYPFDRITGEYEITVNGMHIDTIDEYYEYEIGEKIRLKNDTESFKIKGGAYGVYQNCMEQKIIAKLNQHNIEVREYICDVVRF